MTATVLQDKGREQSTSKVSPVIIAQTKGWMSLNIDELIEYRELFYFLTWRNIKVRYKQTLLGVLWGLLQPIATMAVFTVFFWKTG